MDVSIYSVAAAVLWATVFTKLASCFRRKLPVLRYVSFYPFLLVLLLCIVRAALPLELPFTGIIKSVNVLPKLQRLSRKIFLQFGYIKITPVFLVYAVWIFGVAVIFICRIRNYLRFGHLLDLLPVSQDSRLYRLLALADPQGRLKNVKIIVHESVLSPAAAGFIHPVILLPDISFDDDELTGILLHECAHFKYGHCYMKLAAELVCIIFWWNPFLKELPSELSHVLEMHSDRAVCAVLDRGQQARYLSAFLKIFQHMNGANASGSFICSLMEKADGESLKQRFQMVLGDYYQTEKKGNYLIILAAAAVFLLSYAVILQPHGEPIPEDYGYMEVLSYDEYYCIKTDNGYDLYAYPDCFMVHLEKLEEQFKALKIYTDKDEIR